MTKARLPPSWRPPWWMAAAWLIYLGFVFIEPLRVGTSRAWIWSTVSVAVFLPLYYASWRYAERPRVARATALGIAGVGVALIPINGGGVTYLIYSIASSAFCFPLRAAIAYLAALMAVFPLTTWASGRPFELWMLLMVFAMAAIGGSNIAASHYSRQRRLAEEHAEEMAALAERERIARDLHDVVGHTLSVIALKAELASKLFRADPERAYTEIRDVERVSREALTDVRAAVEGMRRRGLRGELQSAQQALSAAGVVLDADVPAVTLSASQETILALALREAVTNVVRHAKASRCRVSLATRDGAVELQVADDGIGGAVREGSGLAGMRERAASVGGSMSVTTDAGRTVRIRVPAAAPGSA